MPDGTAVASRCTSEGSRGAQRAAGAAVASRRQTLSGTCDCADGAGEGSAGRSATGVAGGAANRSSVSCMASVLLLMGMG